MPHVPASLGKNILLYEPDTHVHAVLEQALSGVGLDVTTVTKIPTVIANDTWLVAGGDDPLLQTRALRESSAASACFLLYPNADMDTDTCPGIAKPFRIAEAVTTLLRLVTRPRDVMLGKHTLHVAARQLELSGKTIALTEKEVAILLHLAQAGAPVTRDTLLHEVWGYHPDATTHTLETHIYRLRQKIETDPDRPQLLLTTEEGYRLA